MFALTYEVCDRDSEALTGKWNPPPVVKVEEGRKSGRSDDLENRR
jgi:hypothetical protein